MRRFLFGFVCFLTGLATLPLLMAGAMFVSARQAAKMVSHDDVVEAEQLVVAVPVAEDSSLADAPVDLVANEPASVVSPLAECPQEQFAEGPSGIPLPEADPFGAGPPLNAVVEPIAEPIKPAIPQLVLPATPDMLAMTAPADAEDAAKLAELRETLQKTVAAKAALLNAAALQAEIAMHQRHEADLQALLELQRLEQSLQELGDKYPESDAGRRAKEVLQLLKNRGPIPVWTPGMEPTPVPVFNPGAVPTPVDDMDAVRRPTRTRSPSPEPIRRGQPIQPTPSF